MRIDVGDRQRARLVRRSGQVRRRLETAEDVRLLEDHARRVTGNRGNVVRDVTPSVCPHLDDLEAEPRRVRLHDLAHLRVDRLAQDDLRAPGHVLRHVTRVRRGGRARRSRTRSTRPSRSARRSPSGTRRSPGASPGSSPAGTACTPSGILRGPAWRRRTRARSGRRSRRRGTRAREPVCALRSASSVRCATISCSESAGSSASSPRKRTASGMSRKSSSTEATPIAASISSRSSSVSERNGSARLTGLRAPSCRPRP